MQWGTDFGETIPRNSGALSASSAAPWRWNGSDLGSRGGGATTKVMVNGLVLNATHVACLLPAVSVDGPGRLTITLPAAKELQWNVTYYQMWDVAVGLRPCLLRGIDTTQHPPFQLVSHCYLVYFVMCLSNRYIAETRASLLLRADAGSPHAGLPLSVAASLPFGGHSWHWRTTGAAESFLPFDLSPLPSTINNDLKITITAPDGINVTRWRRLMRAPVPKTDVGAVQVDHSTRGLRIDGKPWNGNGFFLWSDFMDITNLRNFSNHMPRLVDDGFNVLFMYGLNGVGRPLWNSSYDQQLEFLDNCSDAGMKVIYPPDWGGMNPMGGHGTLGSCATHPMACANESLVHDLKGNITKVMSHPAILGYLFPLLIQMNYR